MFKLFVETFEVKKDGMPGGWLVEKNSDLPFSAVECGEGRMSLLSPGNKYIPVTPDVVDAELRMTVSFNFDIASRFELIVSFRYDLSSRSGEAVRFIRRLKESVVSLEYGKMADNRFAMEQVISHEIPDDTLKKPVEILMMLNGEKLELEFAGNTAVFNTEPARDGKFAISRGQFFDVLHIHRFEILTEKEPVPEKMRKFPVMLPRDPTLYPIKCDVKLNDFGDCIEAELSLSGGVRETPVGEGNYHGKRADWLTNPFFKVITACGMAKFILYEGYILLVIDELAPPHFYGVCHSRLEWPLRRTVRFMAPDTEYCMAVGADKFLHSTMKTRSQSPSETIFDLNGNELYSGIGLTERPQKITFLSQPEKEIIRDLPREDPRYDEAVEFAKNNHYFVDGEDITFTVRVDSEKELPENFEITLENAYLEKLSTIEYKKNVRSLKIGPRTISTVSCSCSVLKGLKPGVYHLRCRSLDASVSAVENYCAFEVISCKPEAPAPPLISGLPYMYTSRTETRGLETDAFDPWNGSSVDEGHYMSCANFLPKCARDNRIGPTVKAYRREWFLWLGSRCSDRPEIKDNLDLLAEADYVDVSEEAGMNILLMLHTYTGECLDDVIDFAGQQAGNAGMNIEKIRRIKEDGGHLDEESFRILATDYWPQWLDFANERFNKRLKGLLGKLQDINPKIELAGYGPGAIYAAHYKGKEFVRYNRGRSLMRRGFQQYEDYPMACRYGIERGTYYLTSSLMALPDSRIYPEIYTTGIGGCPDGAVFYAHPPFSKRLSNDPLRIKRRIFDYAFASAYYTGKGFEYWRKRGFQTCGFDRPRYEALLKAWRTVRDYPPERPLKCAAFVYSEESWRANSSRTVLEKHGQTIIDVRKTSGEAVPFAYEMSRKRQALAGFLLDMENLPGLNENQTGLLVLPPLSGVSQKYLDVIRGLHAKGVNLLAFEDVSGLEDLFGVKDSGEFRRVTRLKAVNSFLDGMNEYCDEPLCEGKYEADGAEVLIEAEIPVLLLKSNRRGKAALFNVPPTLVRDDQLHERLGYGKESISELINAAAGEIVKQLSDDAVVTSAGRIIAFRSKNGAHVVIVTNPDEFDYITPEVRIKKESFEMKFFSCDTPFSLIEENEEFVRLRLKIDREESAVIVLKIR